MFGLWDLSENPALPALTKEHLEILVRGVPYRRRLSEDARRRLGTLTRTFLSEKTFEGCEGLAVTDEMRVTIAAQACVLLLGLEVPCYPGLRSVLIYPGAYKARCLERASAGVVVEGLQGRSGESWRGLVVLAWDVVRRGPEETGAADGIPRMRDRRRDAVWRRTLTAAHARLVKDVEAGRPMFLRPYAATNTHEFFAVSTEAFFEKPEALKLELPELYGQLRDFYRQDPAEMPAV
jgi:Mlc titration factor MtfA (ptsG expression regulator)